MNELILIESKSARDDRLGNISSERAKDVMGKVKALFHFAQVGSKELATSEQVAEFYEIPLETLKTSVKSHKDEFLSDGIKPFRGAELKDAKLTLNLASKISQATLWTPRGALRLGMMLRDSEVAKAIRSALLDMVESSVKTPVPVPALPGKKEELEFLRDAWAFGNEIGLDDRDKLLFKDRFRSLLIVDEAHMLPDGKKQPYRKEYPISDRAIELGYRPSPGQLTMIGRAAAARYRQEHGRGPIKREQFVGGTTRMVNTYSSDDLVIIDFAIQQVMEAES